VQDITITKDEKKINSKVTEVNENNIRYILFNNLLGSTYFLKKSDIASILYENGHVDVFNLNVSMYPSQTIYNTRQYTQIDLKNAKEIRNARITLFAIGMVFTFSIGFSLIYANYGYNYYNYS